MKTTIIYSDELKNYDFGEGHPFRGDRYASFYRLYQEKLGQNTNFELVMNHELADDSDLKRWHTEAYIQAMKDASSGPPNPGLFRFMSGDNINPITGSFPKGIEKAARVVVKNSILAFDHVLNNQTKKAIGIGGGLHHAMSNYGEGFCVYNDVVIGIKHAMDQYGLERILVLDADAHAGNGTCAAFYSDPRILFIDMHQGGIYPSTGSIDEIGEGDGEGYTVNIPLRAGTSNGAYELIFDELIYPLAQAFKPELIVRYGGSDPHPLDGITSLGLTLKGFKMIGEKVKNMSETFCDGRSVDLICSGYNPQILSKAWLTLIAALSGVEIDFEDRSSIKRDQRLKDTEESINRLKTDLRAYWENL